MRLANALASTSSKVSALHSRYCMLIGCLGAFRYPILFETFHILEPNFRSVGCTVHYQLKTTGFLLNGTELVDGKPAASKRRYPRQPSKDENVKR